MASAEEFSIVEYFAENEGYKCGYCKSPNSNYSHGMWAHNMTVQDYQDLIDRGWRRSGRYCYKPTLNVTCCPMYTIKCAALDFKLSKSQKKVLKRVNRFLANGDRKPEKPNEEMNETGEHSIDSDCHNVNDILQFRQKLLNAVSNSEVAKVNSVQALNTSKEEVKNFEDASTSINPSATHSKLSDCSSTGEDLQIPKILRKVPRSGEGVNTSLPKCKKAKLLRKEKKLKKMFENNQDDHHLYKSPPLVKTLEDFLDECLTETPTHRLDIRLVRSSPSSREFDATVNAAFQVYCRYQLAIHNDPPEKCTERQFTRFLVDSPLKIVLVNVLSSQMKGTVDTSWALYVKYQMAIHNDSADKCDMDTYFNFLISSPLEPWQPNDGPPQGYGSFHQQYWLDGKLIAVGVIDILPKCVSSVYFFYDPDYSFLTLGTYGSLREVSFTRSLHHAAPSLCYYYMGFYIHSCPKMRYKGSLSPSFLVCPEVYTWHPIEYCLPLLEKAKYCRFNNNPKAIDSKRVTSISEVLILWQQSAMPYRVYIQRSNKNDDAEEVLQYAQLVGNTCARRMLLIRA